MRENFAIAKKVLEKLEKERPFKFKYSYSPLRDISPADIEDIVSNFLEVKKQEGHDAEEEITEMLKKNGCCKPEDMMVYKGQAGQVSRATHFCRLCGQHWIFAEAKAGEKQEWFSATPAMPAKEPEEKL